MSTVKKMIFELASDKADLLHKYRKLEEKNFTFRSGK